MYYINVIPEIKNNNDEYNEIKIIALFSALIYALTWIIGYAGESYLISQTEPYKVQIQSFQEEIQKITQDPKKAEEITKYVNSIKEKSNYLESLFRDQNYPFLFTRFLQLYKPHMIAIEKFEFTGKDFSLEGIADHHLTVTNYLEHLQENVSADLSLQENNTFIQNTLPTYVRQQIKNIELLGIKLNEEKNLYQFNIKGDILTFQPEIMVKDDDKLENNKTIENPIKENTKLEDLSKNMNTIFSGG